MSSCIQEAFLLKDLSSSLSLYLSFCVSLSSSWSPPDEPWCSPRSDNVWYVSGSAQIAEMWLFIDDRLTGWRRRRRRRRRRKATVRSAPDGSDNQRVFTLLAFAVRADGSSGAPICWPTFQNKLAFYLCSKSFWDSQLLWDRLRTPSDAKFSQLRSSNTFDIFHSFNNYFPSHTAEALI